MSETGPLEAVIAYMTGILAPEVLLSLLVCRKRTGLLLLSRSRSRLTRSRPLDSYIQLGNGVTIGSDKVLAGTMIQCLEQSPQPTSAIPHQAALGSCCSAAAAAAEHHYLMLRQQTCDWDALTEKLPLMAGTPSSCSPTISSAKYTRMSTTVQLAESNKSKFTLSKIVVHMLFIALLQKPLLVWSPALNMILLSAGDRVATPTGKHQAMC